MGKNTVKNTGGITGKGFSKENQPSPEVKKAGWARRKQSQRFMDNVLRFQGMSPKILQKIAQKLVGKWKETAPAVKNGKGKITKPAQGYYVLPNIKVDGVQLDLFDVLAFRYAYESIFKDSFLLDFIDRIVPKAPQNLNLENTGKPIVGVDVTIIRDKATIDGSTASSGDGSPGENSG